MKEYIKNIIAESLKDEVDVDREWERLFSSIEKKTISKMKTRRLFLLYMKYAAAVVLGIGVYQRCTLRIKRTYRQLEIIN